MIEFTWDYIKKQFEVSLETGHEIITVQEYFEYGSIVKKFHINRVDVDFSIDKAERLALIFNDLGIKGTFFVRLHEYNLLSYKNYRILKFIQDSGHEIGLHTETNHQVVAYGGNHFDHFLRDVEILESIINDMVYSYSNHQDNRIDVKNDVDYSGIYSADKIQDNIITVTDSDWTKWKSYLYGKKWTPMDIATAARRYDNIYTLIHPCKYYKRIVFDD